nr:hypothetical protein [Streptomyces sp. 846.5]
MRSHPAGHLGLVLGFVAVQHFVFTAVLLFPVFHGHQHLAPPPTPARDFRAP